MSSLRKFGLCLSLLVAPLSGIGCVTVRPFPLTSNASVQPTGWENSLKEARLAELRQDWNGARRNYEAAHRQNPRNFESVHRLGVVCTHQHQFREADNYYRQAMMLSPEDPALLADMGFSAFMRHDYAQAEWFLERSLRINDKDPNTLTNLAIARAWNGKDDLSLQTFRAVKSEDEAQKMLAAIKVARDPHATSPASVAVVNRNFPVIPVFPAPISAPAMVVVPSSGSELKLSNAPAPLQMQPATTVLKTLEPIELPEPAQLEPPVDHHRTAALQLGTRQAIGMPVIPLHAPPMQTPPATVAVELPPELPGLPPLTELEIPPPVEEEQTLLPPIPSVIDSITMDSEESPIAISPHVHEHVELDSKPLAEHPSVQLLPGVGITDSRPVHHHHEANRSTEPARVEFAESDVPSNDPVIEIAAHVPQVTAWRKTRFPIGVYSARPASDEETIADNHLHAIRQTSASHDTSNGWNFGGICLVTLHHQKTVIDGDPRNQLVYQSRTYQFASAEAMERFRSNPEHYIPVADGNDLVCLRNDRSEVQGSLAFAMRYQNRLYLFSSEENAEEFRRNPQRYLAGKTKFK